MGAQQFPVQARREGDRITGQFQSEGSTYNFTVRRSGKMLELKSDGSTYTLAPQTSGIPAPAATSDVSQARASSLQRAGDFEMALPQGWQWKGDGSGDVALYPSAANPQAGHEELYLVTTLRGAVDPGAQQTASSIAAAAAVYRSDT